MLEFHYDIATQSSIWRGLIMRASTLMYQTGQDKNNSTQLLAYIPFVAAILSDSEYKEN